MLLNIRYLASIREQVGRADEAVTVDAASCSLSELRLLLMAKHGDLLGHEDIRCALNGHICAQTNDRDKALQDGDEIAFFPPMTGG